MQIAFWIVAGLLAAVALMSGTMKLLKTKEALVAGGFGWAVDFKPGTIKFIGLTQVLTAFGVILPALTGIAAWLSPVTAILFAIEMVIAMSVHLRRKESFANPLVLAALAIAVAVLGFLAIA